MRHFISGALALAFIAMPIAATAQDSSMKPGPLWIASRVAVEDGQMQNYMEYLTKTWITNQEFAKSQGWLLDFKILQSVNPRDGEPNIVLLTSFADMPTAAEAERRGDLINKRMQQDDYAADAASGQRGKMRKLMGSVLYREYRKR